MAVGTLLFDAASGPPMGAGEGLGAAAPSLQSSRTPPVQLMALESAGPPWHRRRAASPAMSPGGSSTAQLILLQPLSAAPRGAAPSILTPPPQKKNE